MEKMTVAQIAEYCGGELLCGDKNAQITSVRIDSRLCEAGALFVALHGERVDGNDYLDAAAEKGACCVVTDREWKSEKCAAVRVADPLRALQDIAGGYRRQFSPIVTAVTGSVGKTTTKELMYAVLSGRYCTLKTDGNFNSDSGMPLTALRLERRHEAVVFEMGMNHKGEIAGMTRVGKPGLAVITNIGVSHIEFLGSRHNILYAKLEIERGLPKDGVMILNGDDELLWSVRGKLKHKTVYYGIRNQKALYRAEELTPDETGTDFTLVTPVGRVRARVPVPGEHNVLNALAAVVTGLYSGISLADAAAYLMNFEQIQMRQNIYDYKGIRVLEDCYNASPDSMKAAFTLLAAQPGRKVALIADMLELGKFAPALHEQVGGYAAAADRLIAYGEMAEHYAAGAEKAGMARENIKICENAEEAAEALLSDLKEGDAVLFKGSRGLHTERVLEKMKEEWENK